MTRTGLFHIVVHAKVEAFHAKGWMVVADLGPYSVFMWHCECGECGP